MPEVKECAVILLSDPERAGELARAVESDSVEASVLFSSDELHRALQTQRVDVVILENELQAFVTGLDILERIFNDLMRPTTLLLAHRTSKVDAKVQRLGIHAVLPPDTPVDQIASKVRSLGSSSQRGTAVIPPAARRIAADAQVQPMPQLLAKLAGYLSDDVCVPVGDLARDLSLDAKITADLMRMINSAAMGMTRKINRVFDVVTLLGARRTISLVLSNAMLQGQSRLCRQLGGSDRDWFHQRSVLIASTNHAFAEVVAKVSADTAFVLGLFQDLGIPILAGAWGEKYVNVLRRVRDTGILRLETVEQQEFGITHADVSAAMLQKWQLPPSILGPVLDHHRPERLDTKPAVEQRFVFCMRAGEAFANLSNGHFAHRYPVLREALSRFGPDQAENCNRALRDAVQKTAESSQLFQMPAPNPESLRDLVGSVTQPPAAGAVSAGGVSRT